ncbi:MAG TPA: hypothetical protein VFL59_12270 [Candidatus Nanopelagicales bacterium]|nr:hypothetical protein [Candidatus Nanopelagicales bacterium]
MTDDRPSAYADLLAALLAVRKDPATTRFDAELAAAEARGDLDPVAARTLRWWQRESLRGLSDHLASVLPHLLDDLAAAQSAASESVEESAAAWSAASAATDLAVNGPEPGGPGAALHLRPVDDLRDEGRGPFRPGPTLASSTSPEPPEPPEPPRPISPGFAPPDPGPSAAAGSPGQVPTGVPRPRLLVSGITVRAESSGPFVDLTDSARRPADPAR